MADESSPGEAVKSVGQGLGKKLGPLPIWLWIILGGAAGVFLWYRVLKPGQGAASTLTTTLGGTPLTGGGGGGGGGSTGGGGTAVAVSRYTTNASWLTDAISQTQNTLGLPIAQVQLYLQEFLAGRSPVGTETGLSDFNRVVQTALQFTGQPPEGFTPSTGGANFFSANYDWLQNLFAFLPSGSNPGIRQELTDLVMGVRTNLSQEAAAALQQAEQIIGASPTSVSYGVAGPAWRQLGTGEVKNWLGTNLQHLTGEVPWTFDQFKASVVQFFPQIANYSDATLASLYNSSQRSPIVIVGGAGGAQINGNPTAAFLSAINAWTASLNQNYQTQQGYVTGGAT